MLADGSNGSVEFLDDRLVIRRKGFANKLTQGFQGDKTIMARHITGVQFRPAGSLLAGYVQFTVMGGREYGGGLAEATKDENAVLFTAEQQGAFEDLRDAVQNAIAFTGSGHPTAGASAASDLVALAGLLERGLLTREEYDEQKARLLAPAQPRTREPNRTPAEHAVDGPAAARASSSTKGCMWAVAVIAVIFLWFVIAGGR